MFDQAWKYRQRASEHNRTAIICVFCNKTFKGGIFRHKHLISGDSNVATIQNA